MKILVTGASGFVGRNLVPLLQQRGHEVRYPSIDELDLLQNSQTHWYLARNFPEAVIHLAANCGGIQYNQAHQAELWHDNTLMGMNLLNLLTRIREGVPLRVVMLSTTCGYPRSPKTIPFIEEEFWDGLPEPTNAAYGIAKRSLAFAAGAYRRQFGLDARVLIPTNLYGPHDHFDDPSMSHVIPGLMQKMREAMKMPSPHLQIWGDGAATRDFLYAPDAAEAIALAVERETWPDETPMLNLGSGTEITISKLVSELAGVSGYQGSITWDSSKPSGQPRRVLDTRKAKKVLEWEATTPLAEGLKKTWDWYLENAQ